MAGRVRTHWDGCWRDQAHHACAVAEVGRLREALESIRDYRPAAMDYASRGAVTTLAVDLCGIAEKALAPRS